MSAAKKREPLYVFFMTLMVLLGLIGIALFVYGALHQGAPLLPGRRIIARLLHG